MAADMPLDLPQRRRKRRRKRAARSKGMERYPLANVCIKKRKITIINGKFNGKSQSFMGKSWNITIFNR
jgi:hypothetical protein